VHNALDDSDLNKNNNSGNSSHEECIASNNSLIKLSELQGTAEDLEMIRRERNRLHAKNTRIRKKASQQLYATNVQSIEVLSVNMPTHSTLIL
jgi:hypothetical protein